jgi:hypothetical protein
MGSANTKVAVITATIGHPGLERALLSVRNQSHTRIDHLVVVDGPEFADCVTPTVQAVRGATRSPDLLVLPRRTGMDGYCSHRIYAAMPFLVDADYVAFLDQDNWYSPAHIEALLGAVSGHDAPAAYSLRNICDAQGTFVCHDDCQSLGLLAECYDAPGIRHIDANCWLVSRRLATTLARHWNQRHYGDRVFASSVMANCPHLPCTGQYSVNYTAGSRQGSATTEFFLRGNRVMQERYPEGIPWRVPKAREPMQEQVP